MSLRDSDSAVAAIQRLQSLGSNVTPRANPLLDIPTSPDQPGYHDRINATAVPDDEIEEMDAATGLPLSLVQPSKRAVDVRPDTRLLNPVDRRGDDQASPSNLRLLVTFSRDPRNLIVSVVDDRLNHVYARAIVDGLSLVSLYPVLEAITEIVDLAGVWEVFGASDGEDAPGSARGHRRRAESGTADSRRPDPDSSEGAAPPRGPARRRSRGTANPAG